METIFQSVLPQVNFAAPNILGALISLFFGLLLSLWVRSITVTFIKTLRIDDLLKRIGITHFFSTVDVAFSAPHIIGLAMQSLVVIFSLLLASEMVNLQVFSQLLEKVIMYYPRIFIAILIGIAGAKLIDISQKMVVGTITLRHISFSRILGKVLDWSIRILVSLAVLYELAIIPELIFIVFAGFILTLSLAAGISFGLAGKKPVEKILTELGTVFAPKE